MEALLACLVGGLFAVSIYLFLQGNLVRVVAGVVLYTNAVNLLIFALGRLPARGRPPLIPEQESMPIGAVADPVAQALVLTSIVISFGLLAFALVLVYRSEKEFGTLDPDRLRESDSPRREREGPRC